MTLYFKTYPELVQAFNEAKKADNIAKARHSCGVEEIHTTDGKTIKFRVKTKP